MARAFPSSPFSLSRAGRLAWAIGDSSPATLTDLVQSGLTASDALWLAKQGIAPYLRHRLRQNGLLVRLPSEVATRLTLGYSLSAVHEAVQHEGTLAGVLETLATAGIEVVVLKGMAFAHTIYPAPHLRPKSDIDLWIQPAQLPHAIEHLTAIGFRLADGERAQGVQTWQEGEIALVFGATSAFRIELQFPPMRGLWARQCATIDHTTLWQRTVPVTIAGQPARVLSTADALIHVAYHQAINHQFTYPCWLRSLLDIHLLVKEGKPQWDVLVASARAWNLQTVTWTVLTLAQRLLGTPIPSEVLANLAPSTTQQQMIRRLDLERIILEAHPADYQLRRYAVQIALTDHPVDSLRLMGRALFPDSAWLRARYPDQPDTRLPLHHWRRLVTTGNGK
jgi:hypothetical protein